MVLVKHVNDKIVIPNESAWFGFYDEFGMNEIPMEENKIYQLNLLGLQEMNRDGRIIRLLENGGHLHFDSNWIAMNIIPYLIEV